MNEIVGIVLVGIIGLLLGGFFFGGLWWTVRRGVKSSRPALFFMASLIIRILVVLGGFYLVCRDDWRRFVACLAGFIIAKFIVLKLDKTASKKLNPSEKESPNAHHS